MAMDKRLIMVKNGYERIAKRYLQERAKNKTNKWVRELSCLLPPEAVVLDIGCGAGVPVDNLLMKEGLVVHGIDNSKKQIELARKLCKGGDYKLRDAFELELGEYRVSAIVCLFVMFHIPRDKHLERLLIFNSYLPKGGYMLLSMGDVEFEGEHVMLGERMWASQWSRGKNLELVRQAGFEIVREKIESYSGERHQILLAKKL